MPHVDRDDRTWASVPGHAGPISTESQQEGNIWTRSNTPGSYFLCWLTVVGRRFRGTQKPPTPPTSGTERYRYDCAIPVRLLDDREAGAYRNSNYLVFEQRRKRAEIFERLNYLSLTLRTLERDGATEFHFHLATFEIISTVLEASGRRSGRRGRRRRRQR